MSRSTKSRDDQPKGLIVRLLIAVVILIGTFLLAVTDAMAVGLANPRAMGMGGAYTSHAKGFHAPAFNPANLGLASHRGNGLELVGAGVSISNNSFSLDDYNAYTGATLSEQDKETLLGKIPADGLKISADAEASALSLGLGSMALSLSGIGAAEVSMNRDVAELLLQGNTMADTVNLNGTYAEGYGLASVNLSYGRPLVRNLDRVLAVGATVRYLRGFGYEKVTELNGHAATLATGFEGDGRLISRTALGGWGYGIDLGAALQISKNYTAGATLFNALSSIQWNRETEEHRYSFTFDTLTAANIGNDSVLVSNDSTVAIGAFSTTLPATIRAGLAKTNGQLRWAVDWEQGFRRGAGTTTRPRLSTGAELHLIPFVPLRAGFAVGGKQGTTYAGGIGIDFSVCYLDIAAANYNAISGSSGKGLNLAIASGIRF